MNTMLTYGVNVSLSELVEHLDEKFVERLCERLRVKRDNITSVPFLLNDHGDILTFFNVVGECDA